MCLRTISIFFSVNYLFIIFAHYVLIVDLSFIGWQGALYVLEIPFLDMSFRLSLSHNVAYGVYYACHEKKGLTQLCEPDTVLCPVCARTCSFHSPFEGCS